MKTVKTYYHLTKPGIIRGNAITTAAGFFLASRGHLDGWLLLAILLGASLVVASGCVFNNYLDREIDKKMDRTKGRAMVLDLVSGKRAMIYASILGLLGFVVLAQYTNLLTLEIGALGLFFYVIIYGYAKRKSVHGTVIGSIAGAVPPVAGYTAVTGRFDSAALILFLMLVLWQMPHFYAIAMYRLDDYAAAKIPVLPIVRGMVATKLQTLTYIVAFVIAASALTFLGYTGNAYLIITTLVGLAWFGLGLRGLATPDNARWGRTMFRFSLLAITVVCIMMSVDVKVS